MINIRPLPARTTGGATEKRNRNVSITPASLNNNPFVANFANAVRCTGRSVFDADWQLRKLRKADVAVIHWPDYFFDDGKVGIGRKRLLKMIVARRLFGTRFVWVIHNLKPHFRTSKSALEDRFINLLDGVIHLSREGKIQAEELYEDLINKKNIVSVHGNFIPIQKPLLRFRSKESSRINILTFGAIKPYKNVEAVISSVVASPDQGLLVSIFGKAVDKDYVDSLRNLASDARIEIDAPEYSFSDELLEAKIDESDIVVLPYRDILNSGSAFLALSRFRPIVAPRRGALPELQRTVGTEWVYLFDGELTSATLRDVRNWYQSRNVPSPPDMSAYDWSRVSEDLDQLLEML